LQAAGGIHAPADSLHDVAMGHKELFFATPTQETVLVVPELITHYMMAHGYQPPIQLRTAVAWRPPIEV
jgi:hypothetical protein